jgi:hypothetical protein
MLPSTLIDLQQSMLDVVNNGADKSIIKEGKKYCIDDKIEEELNSDDDFDKEEDGKDVDFIETQSGNDVLLVSTILFPLKILIHSLGTTLVASSVPNRRSCVRLSQVGL